MWQRTYYLFLMLTLGVWFAVDASSVSACSGGAPLTIQGLLHLSDYIVKAHAVETDDAGQNVILAVESYLVGGAGPAYLLLDRNDPIFTQYVLSGRSSGGDCLGLSATLSSTDTFYAFLRRHDNGSYTVVSTLFNPYLYRFHGSTSKMEVFLEGGYENGEEILEFSAERGTGQEVTESEFLEIIASQSGETPTNPDTFSHYPLKSPLLITTQNNSYIFPVDWQNPVSVTGDMLTLQEHPMDSFGFSDARRCGEGQIVISPDNLNIAITREDNTICFTWGYTVEGQSVLFSATSDAVAVWNECQLSIYTLGYPRLLQEWFDIERINRQELVANNCQLHHQHAAWSPDGRLLAYSDNTGIWLWDVFNSQPEPHLIVSGGSPNHFSPLGRYLNYFDGEKNVYVDIVSGESLPDGLFSRDEQLFINFDSQITFAGYEVCTVRSNSCATAAPMYVTFFDEHSGEVANVTYPNEVRKTVWQSPSLFLQLACVAELENSCRLFRFYPGYFGWENSLIGTGIDFDYDASNQTLAILQDLSTIVIDGITVSLHDTVDEDIQKIEWLPSLFYRN